MSPPAEVTDLGGGFSVYWPDQNIRVLIEYLSKQTNGLIGEATILDGQTTLCESLRINLNSEPKTKSIAKKVHENDGRLTLPDWARLIESTCVLVLRRYREGDPLRVLTADTPIEPLTFQLNPLVFKNKPTVLFGDGGLGKSSLGLLAAMLVSTGQSLAGLSAVKGCALYLDYEDSHEVHVRRMQAIAAAHPELKAADVRYLALNEPLFNLTHTLLRRVQAEHISFAVLDSLAAATGGDAGAEAAAKVFRTIRALNVGSLVLAHVPKGPTEGQEPSIYGSVFNKNFSRATWELKREQAIGDDTSVLGLFNRKSNLSRLHHPIGLKVTQNAHNTLMRYEQFDLTQAAELVKALPAPAQIRNFLEDGTPRTAKAISERTGLNLETVKSTLSREKGRKWQMLGGAGQDTLWCVLGSK